MRYLKLFENFDYEKITDILIEYIDNGSVIDRGNEYCDIFECKTYDVFKNVKNRLDEFNSIYYHTMLDYCNNNGLLYPSSSMSNEYKVRDGIFISKPCNDILSILQNRFDNIKHKRDDKEKESIYYNNNGLSIFHRENVGDGRDCYYINGEIFKELDNFKLNYTQKQILLKSYMENILNLTVSDNPLDLEKSAGYRVMRQFGLKID